VKKRIGSKPFSLKAKVRKSRAKRLPSAKNKKRRSSPRGREITRVGASDVAALRLPPDLRVAAVVSAMNEEAAIGKVLDQLQLLRLHEIIVVVNGSTDGTWHRVRNHPSSPVALWFPERLGHDVGRAVGAKVSQAEIVLFLDGDIPISAKQLMPFIQAVAKGCDIALNNVTPFLGRFARRDPVTVVKEFLNRSLSRPDLGANSLTAIPHALSRKAIERITPARLAVPPSAQAAAIGLGLTVSAPASVNVFNTNRHRASNTGLVNPVADLIIGDHLEALRELMELQGERLSYPDLFRKREAASGKEAIPCG